MRTLTLPFCLKLLSVLSNVVICLSGRSVWDRPAKAKHKDSVSYPLAETRSCTVLHQTETVIMRQGGSFFPPLLQAVN